VGCAIPGGFRQGRVVRGAARLRPAGFGIMGAMPVPTDGVPTKGMLLVATPPLVDPNFDRTVILVLEHGDGGAIGLVLNRPSETAIADALPGWEDLAAAPATVFAGGPVSTDAAIAL